MAVRVSGGWRTSGNCPPKCVDEATVLRLIQQAGATSLAEITALLNERMQIPQDVFYVAKAWSSGPDNVIFFTDIQSAINAAAASFTANSRKPTVVIYPGAYVENLVIPPTVAMSIVSGTGEFVPIAGAGDVFVTGTLTWSPAAGSSNTLAVNGIVISGAVTLTGGGGGGLNRASFIGSRLAGAFTCSSTINPTFDTCQMLTVALSAASQGTFNSTTITGAVTATGASTRFFTNAGTTVAGAIALTISAQSIMKNSTLTSMSVDATSQADIRGSEYTGTLSGAGKIDRSFSQFTATDATSPTIFVPAYITVPTSIQFSLTNGAGGTVVAYTAKTINGFTLDDRDGGRIVDALIYLK